MFDPNNVTGYDKVIEESKQWDLKSWGIIKYQC